MANAVYPKGKERILAAAINFPSDTLKVALLKSAYAYSAAHEFLSDLGSNRLGTDATLTGKTTTNGQFDANDPTFAAVAPGDTAAFLVIYKDTGVAGTSPLLFFFDQITGFPVATNGGDITPQWDNTTRRIYTL